MALILIVVLATVGFLISDLVRNNPKRVAERESAERLSDARQALIAHARKAWCQTPTGLAWDQLPCPANDAGGVAAAFPCGGTVTGRVPWKTLGLPPLKDNAGECFWMIRNSAARTLQVIAPGPAVGTQQRGTAVATPPWQCSTAAANQYLEATSAANYNDIELVIQQTDVKEEPRCQTSMCNAADGPAFASYVRSQGDCRVPPGNTPDPLCINFKDKLAGCSASCATAASDMLNPPCLNNPLTPPQCQAALSALDTCTP